MTNEEMMKMLQENCLKIRAAFDLLNYIVFDANDLGESLTEDENKIVSDAEQALKEIEPMKRLYYSNSDYDLIPAAEYAKLTGNNNG